MNGMMRWLLVALALPSALSDCVGDHCAMDSADIEALVQTRVAHKADAGGGGSAAHEKHNASHQHHAKVVSIQRHVTIQNSSTTSCDGIVDAMGRGINIGNTYEFNQGDKNPEVVKQQIKWAFDLGLKHVRIPVTWGDHFDANALLTQQVTECIDYALGLGLYVVTNTHHEHWLKDSYDGSTYYKDKFWNLWTGIATHFASRSNKLIFEILNEPEHAFGSWGGNPQPFDQIAIDRTREINGVGYGAVRQVPGNEHRFIFLSPNAMSSIGTAKAIYPTKYNMPGGGNDACLGVEVHSYDPWAFAGPDGSTDHYANLLDMKKDLYSIYKDLRDWQFDQHIPLYVGEFGVGRHTDRQWDRDDDRVREYYKFLPQHFRQNGWSCAAWDDFGWFAVYNAQQYGFHTAITTPYV